VYLDEATSSLDPISRLLAFAALKTWRRNKTTIVITHDLTQVEPGDFVYVLKGGKVVEQGFRYDLESEGGQGPGEFRRMVDAGLGGGQEGEREESEDKVDDDEDEDEKRRSQSQAYQLRLNTSRCLRFGPSRLEIGCFLGLSIVRIRKRREQALA